MWKNITKYQSAFHVQKNTTQIPDHYPHAEKKRHHFYFSVLFVIYFTICIKHGHNIAKRKSAKSMTTISIFPVYDLV